jgi:predicted nucleotidyltransferase
MNAESALKRAAELVRQAGAEEVYVFGSMARGEARNDSDIDLAVRGLPWIDCLRLMAELPPLVGRGVDLILLDWSRFALHIEEKIARGWARRVA